MNSTMLTSPLAAAPAHAPFAKTDRRFTLDGNDELEHRLALVCDRIRGALRGLFPANKLEGVLLGGGYGRGQGGVLAGPEGDHQPYNDLEFYVYLRGNRHLNELRYHRPLEVLAQILTPQIGVEVEFKIASLDEFRRSPVSMFSYDLVSGHRRLLGPEDLLAGCNHHKVSENIPLSEATRLLMNRCSGLLFARERLARNERFTEADADFVARNIAKAQLAFGDAVLTARGRYHWSCLERQRRLASLPADPSLSWQEQVGRHHAAGVFFKLHPERSTASVAQLKHEHEKVTALGLQLWLWLESRRLETIFSSARDYVANPINKCPETTAGRNWLVNLKTLGPRSCLRHGAFHHPRERILHSLALLLWQPDALRSAHWCERLQSELGAKARDFPTMITAYQSRWSHVN
jgi:hypothetical protein